MPITVTRVRDFLNDADGDNVADQGDTFVHTITIINGEATPLTNLFLTESENGITIDAGSFRIGPIEVDDSLGTIQGNTPVSFTTAQLVGNDIDPDDANPQDTGHTITAINGTPVVDPDGNPIAVANIPVTNGTVTSNGDGTFSFKPTTGYEGAASFTYDSVDEDGIPSATATPATVSVTVGDCVWYVDANAAPGGDGSFGSAFQTLAPLTTGGGSDTLDDSGDTIFVYDRGSTNGGSIVLEDGQSLLGDGSSLTSVNGNSVGASTSNSDVGSGSSGIIVTLANGNTISGVDILGQAGSTAVGGTNFGTLNVSNATIDTAGAGISLNTGTVAGSGFTSTDSDAGTNNVSLTAVTGTLNLGGGALLGATGSNINISGGTVALDYNGSIAQAAGGSVLNVSGGHGTGTVSLDGSVTANSGNGLQFDNADGTYNLNGVVNLNGGGAGIDILNGSSGTFTFGTVANQATLSHTAAGDAFVVNASAANVTFNGAISDALGNAVNIADHDGGTIAFNGTVDSSGVNATGIDITESGAGSVSFNGAVTLSTGANAALTMTGNSGSTISFSSAGVDLTTTSGTALTFTGGGELNIAGSDNDVTTSTGKLIDINGGTTGTGLNFDRIDANGTVVGTAVSINNLDADANAGDGVEAFTANVIEVANTSGAGADGVNISGGASVLFDVNLVTVTTAADDGVHLDSTVGPNGAVDIDTLNVTAVAEGLEITGGSQTIDIDAGSIGSTGTEEAVFISGGNATIDITATVTKTTVGNVVEVDNRTGGTVTFSGNVSGTGAVDNGIRLDGNAGTISFTGDKTLTTGAGTAVSITNNTANVDFLNGDLVVTTTTGTGVSAGTIATATAGTLTISGTGNTISSTTGSALVVNGTDIDGSINLQSVSSSGAVSGVYLADTGTGSFIVTGTGALNSGGTISGSTGAGMNFINTGAISLTRVLVQNGQDDGIRGNNVNGFTLDNSTIQNNGNALTERGIEILDLKGSGGISNSTISGSAERNLQIENENATLTSFNITGSTFKDTNTTTGLGDDGILVLLNGSGSMTVSVTGNTFTDNKGDHFQAATDADASGQMNITFTGNTLSTTAARDDGGNDDSLGGGVTVNSSGTADIVFNISNNNIQQAFDDAININLAPGSKAGASINGTINANTIGTAGQLDSGSESSHGITVASKGLGSTTIAVTNNVINQYGNEYGIQIDTSDGSSNVNAVVTGNTVKNPGTFAINAIHISAGATANNIPNNSADNGILEVTLTGNDVTGGGKNVNAGEQDIRLRQRFNTTIKLPGYLGAAGDNNAVNAFVAANNDPNGANPPAAPTVSSVDNFGGGGGGFIGGPDNMLAAPVLPPIVLAPPVTEGENLNPGSAYEPQPYVDPTPQGGPAGDPNPVPTDTGSSGGTGGTGTGGTDPVTPAPEPEPAALPLTQAQLDALVEAAIERWAEAGATPEQLAAMRATKFAVADMAGTYLGTSKPGEVLVDSDGAGHGWFVDSTPGEDSEFGASGGVLKANAGGDAFAKMDLLTVVMHELGHQVGLDDLYGSGDSAELMYGFGRLGERRLAEADDLVNADMSHGGHEAFLESSPTVASLPPGRGVVIRYTSTVDSFDDVKIPLFTNKSTAETDNFPDAFSPDENLAIDGLTLGGTVFIDANVDGDYDAGEGVGNVTVTLYADTDDSGNYSTGDALIDTDTTDSNGDYSFTGLSDGDFIVRVDATNFDTGEELDNQVSGDGEADPDGTPDVDGDDNGVAVAAGLGGGVASKTITLVYDGEPTSDGGAVPKNDVNTTLDFGFIDPNDAPVITTPGASPTGTEDGGAIAIGGLSIADVDAGTDNVAVTLSIASGTLALTSTTGLTVGGNGATLITLEGNLTDLNASLATLSWTPAADSNGDFDLTVTANDNGSTGPDPGGLDPNSEEDVATVTITVTAVDDAGDDSHNVGEDSGIGTVDVGTNDDFEDPNAAITAAGPASNGTVTLNNAGTVGDLTDDFIQYTPNADFNGSDSFTYTVTAGGVTETATVNVTVSAVVDIADDSHVIDEDSGVATVPVLANDTFEGVEAITIVGSAANGTAVLNNAGTVGDLTDDFVQYTPDADYNGSDSFTYTVTSGGVTEQATVNVTINALNDAPTETGLGADSVTWTEGDSAVLLDNGGNVSLDDVDSTDFNGGSLTVSIGTGKVAGEDQLLLQDAGTVTIVGGVVKVGGNDVGNVSGGGAGGDDLFITFTTGFATPDAVEAIIAAVRYDNSGGEKPTDGNRVINWTLVDGDGNAGGNEDRLAIASNVDVVAVNDAPTLQLSAGGPGATLAYEEGDDASVLAPTAVFDDLDSRDFDGGKLEVQFDSGSAQTGDVLSILEVGGIEISGTDILYDNVDIGNWTNVANLITVTFDEDADVEAVDALIQAFAYENTLDSPNTSSRFVNFKVTEADGVFGQANATVNFTAVNDPPVNSPGSAVNISEDGGAVALNGITVDDPDAGASDIGIGFAVSHGILAVDSTIAQANGIGAGDILVNPDGRAVAFTGTLAEINALLAANGLTYTPDANYNGTDTVVILTNDDGATGADPGAEGAGGTGTTTDEQDVDNLTINIAAVNDPVTSTVTSIASGDEDTAIPLTLSIADVDAALAPNGVYSVKLTATNGTVTIGTTGLTFTAGGNGTATMTVTGTLAAINTALSTAAFTGNANYNGSASVQIDVTDDVGGTVATGASGTGTSDSDTISITVNSVDDDSVAGADVNITNEASPANGNVLGNDVDPDGGPAPLVTAVNGVAGDVGDMIELDSGALLKLNEDGTYTYDPNGAFDHLALSGLGASNDTATDSFQYTITGGSVATVTITIKGLYSAPHRLEGTSGDDTINGTNQADIFVSSGGADLMIGKDGGDSYNMDNLGDRTVEKADEGIDSVRTTVNFTLGGHVENLTLIAGAVSGTGNGQNNLITGSGGANVLSGENGFDTLLGLGGNDKLFGGGNDDLLDGGIGADELRGGVASDTLRGDAGSDKLYGETGNDVMTGGAGNDQFYFNTALNRSSNVDQITDFLHGTDKIYLDRAVFSAISANGTLTAGAFHVGASAADASDRIIYNSATGQLFYDADGLGGVDQMLFVRLEPGLPISAADFVGYI